MLKNSAFNAQGWFENNYSSCTSKSSEYIHVASSNGDEKGKT
jgi:hypothetical protein